ncbi:hypothetical protein [Listeria grayi]|nr:hypothetical protein [Listeria grayi]
MVYHSKNEKSDKVLLLGAMSLVNVVLILLVFGSYKVGLNGVLIIRDFTITDIFILLITSVIVTVILTIFIYPWLAKKITSFTNKNTDISISNKNLIETIYEKKGCTNCYAYIFTLDNVFIESGNFKGWSQNKLEIALAGERGFSKSINKFKYQDILNYIEKSPDDWDCILYLDKNIKIYLEKVN